MKQNTQVLIRSGCWGGYEGTWTLGPKRGDSLRRFRCRLTRHDWQWNERRTQSVCYRCWTVRDAQQATP